MFGLYALAALATLAIPVLVPMAFEPDRFPTEWVPPFLVLEMFLSAFYLKSRYPQHDFIRCLTVGLSFLLTRVAICFLATMIDPRADLMRVNLAARPSDVVVPTLIYMYAYWWVSAAQYVALLLWMPHLLETMLPGYFAPKFSSVEPEEGPTVVEPPRPATVAAAVGEPLSFIELETQLAATKGLLGWMVFAPDRLPVWHYGPDASILEHAPQVLRRLDDVCQPLFHPDLGKQLRQGMFQTDHGLCVVASLPGDFVFSSLWECEQGSTADATVLYDVIRRVEHWLSSRFAEFA